MNLSPKSHSACTVVDPHKTFAKSAMAPIFARQQEIVERKGTRAESLEEHVVESCFVTWSNHILYHCYSQVVA